MGVTQLWANYWGMTCKSIKLVLHNFSNMVNIKPFHGKERKQAHIMKSWTSYLHLCSSQQSTGKTPCWHPSRWKLHRVAALKWNICRKLDKMKSNKLPGPDVSPRHFQKQVNLRTQEWNTWITLHARNFCFKTLWF